MSLFLTLFLFFHLLVVLLQFAISNFSSCGIGSIIPNTEYTKLSNIFFIFFVFSVGFVLLSINYFYLGKYFFRYHSVASFILLILPCFIFSKNSFARFRLMFLGFCPFFVSMIMLNLLSDSFFISSEHFSNSSKCSSQKRFGSSLDFLS